MRPPARPSPAGAEHPGAHHVERHLVEPHVAEEFARFGAGIHHQHREMVLQVLADRQIDERGDADRAQMIGRADAGEHQNLRRVEGAAAEDDFALGIGVQRLAALFIVHAGGPVALHRDARDMGPHLDRKILPLHRRMEIADRGRAALAVADRILGAAEALPRAAVVVAGDRRPAIRADSSQAVNIGSLVLAHCTPICRRCRGARSHPPASSRPA